MDAWNAIRSPQPAFHQARAKDYGGTGDPLTADECEAIRRGRAPLPDADAAALLVASLSDYLLSVSTGGPRIELLNDAYQREHRALTAALRRLELDNPCPFRDLWKWHSYYSANLGTSAQRRVYVADLFAEARDALDALTDHAQSFEGPAWEGPTGWRDLDAKLDKLRRDFRAAATPDDFRAVGLFCVSTLEALGRVVYDQARPANPGNEVPKGDDAKARLEAFFDAAATGDRFKAVRAMVRPALKQAHRAKHSPTANETDAGIVCSAVAFVVQAARAVEREAAISVPQSRAA
jgi:hypothetical protein